MDCFRSPASQQDYYGGIIFGHVKRAKYSLKAKNALHKVLEPCVPGAIVWRDKSPELGTAVATTKNFEPDLTPAGGYICFDESIPR
mmetsp:Transcript_20675/g.31616  ORF Transcript_20675/g.31616 Transcript_20675/m.31616 type:complete len:86 (+) Transcript_20675:655-912(+)